MNFVDKRVWFFLVSLLVILPGIVYLIIAPGLNPGIDFTGGSTMTLQLGDEVQQEDLRADLAALGYPDAIIQRLEAGTFFVRTKELSNDQQKTIFEGLGVSQSEDCEDDCVRSFDLVSPVFARGTVINSFWAVVLAAAGMFGFIWWAFRNVPKPWRYGAAAIIALLHDTVIVLGVFAILGEVMDMEVNLMFLFALLTVIGYSVNDTIVVFDRVRENIQVYANREFTDVVNLSISEAMGRSINTSMTLLFTLLALYLFGGDTIRSFVLVMLIGVVAGTYSSIAIATQVLVAWEQGDFGQLFKRIRSPLPARAS